MDGRQDRREAACEHGLPGPRGSEQQQIVIPRSSHLERALRVRLAADLGQVVGMHAGLREERSRIDRRRGDRRLAAQAGHGLGERRDAVHGRPVREGGLGGIGRRNDHPVQVDAARSGCDRERPADGVDASVQAELSDHAPARQVG